jgi:hypothetical protein
MARILALDILKAAPQHAQTLGSSGLAMLLAITGQWDTLGCTVAVCWSNSRMSERTGLSRNSIDVVRSRLVKAGWLSYIQDGRQAGHYIPQLPDYHAQMSAVECASGAQFTVQVLCNDCASTVQLSVQPLRSSLGSYIPSPVPSPEPNPILEKAAERPKIKTPVRNNPPSLEQVAEYIQKQGYNLSPEDFHDGNTRGGWTYGKGGKSLVYDWKAHVRTWEAWQKKNNPPPPPPAPRPKAPPINLDFT